MDETRVNASYLARLVGFVLALILFGLVIWFVVQLGQDENGIVATDDEENATTVTDDIVGDSEVVVVDGSGDGSQNAATDEELQTAASGSTNTGSTSGQLEVAAEGVAVAGEAVEVAENAITPETGPVDTTLGAIAIGLTIVAFRKYRQSRVDLPVAI